jgi:hypothetical protein
VISNGVIGIAISFSYMLKKISIADITPSGKMNLIIFNSEIRSYTSTTDGSFSGEKVCANFLQPFSSSLLSFKYFRASLIQRIGKA